MNTLTVKSDLKTKLSKIDVVYLVKNGKITEFFDFDGVLVPRGTILSSKHCIIICWNVYQMVNRCPITIIQNILAGTLKD